jgi:hypothetical protein
MEACSRLKFPHVYHRREGRHFSKEEALDIFEAFFSLSNNSCIAHKSLRRRSP